MTDETQPCADCQEDPVGMLKQLFVDRIQAKRIRLGQDPALRPVFSKTHGVAHGWFEPLPDLEKPFRTGVFDMSRLAAWVRFSSDMQPGQSDGNQTCGIAIKLFGVPGPKLCSHGDTQDFLLQNHDVFMVNTAADMCELTKVSLVGEGQDAYRRAHQDTDRIFKEMAKVEASVLSATYWSVLPYAFGADRHVKYKLVPQLRFHGVPPNDANYLSADLARRLREEGATFDFYLQFQNDPEKQPLDQATRRWEEAESAPVHVATLFLPRQDINSQGQASYGQNLAYNPWHSLEAHKPEGSLAEARREVYAASADLRRSANGVPANEPGEPRAPGVPDSTPSHQIVHAAIYPSIGVARVGNSRDEFFLGPEVAEPEPRAPGFYRDSSGALKRQAARFRIYGLNAAGVAVRELTAGEADIQWTVHLANKKAAWYQFQIALDIPEAGSAPPSLLRNAAVADRNDLVIDPGAKRISGKDSGGKGEYAFNGKFLGCPVYLGELRTDPEGRLIVLGGRGQAASSTSARAITFANNEGWYDDISDGPVTAEVTYRGEKLQVDPAWIVVAPPNYAPERKSVRTMWDLMRDVAIRAKALPRPLRPSFELDVRPLLERLSGLQWVNAGFAAAFGWGGPSNLAEPAMLDRLSRNDPADAELRKTISNQFRVFDRDSLSPQPWPWLWGDAMNTPPLSARAFTALTETQLGMLQQWAAGAFDADYDPGRKPVREIGDLPVPEQPDMLIRAAMEFCLADAFHPGAEMTWPMRNYSLYRAPFRIEHAPPDAVEPDFGEELVMAAFPGKQGPLGQQWPGGLTRWMGVPWQTDAASCDSGYDKYDPYLPSFWPARVPNQVMTAENYAVVMDHGRPLGDRLAAFAQRADWMRPLGSGYVDKINKMVAHFGEMGIVERQPGPGDPAFPAIMEVESLATPVHESQSVANQQTGTPHTEREKTEKTQRFIYGLRRG